MVGEKKFLLITLNRRIILKTDEFKSKLHSLLEDKRNLMIQKGLAEGLGSPDVLKISTEVDQLIYSSMKGKMMENINWRSKR